MIRSTIILLFVSLVSCMSLSSQGYFSIVEDVLLTGDNIGIDVHEVDDTLFVYAGLNCFAGCQHTSILKLEANGIITEQVHHLDLSPSLEYFSTDGQNLIYLLSKNIKKRIGTPYSEGISDTLLLVTSELHDLNTFRIDTIAFSDSLEYSNQGVLLDGNKTDLLFFGQYANAEDFNTIDDIDAAAYINRVVDGSNSIEPLFRYDAYIANNQIVDLQIDSAGHYHFLILGQDDISAGAPIGEEKDPHWHIIEIDSIGNVLNEIYHIDLGSPSQEGLNFVRLKNGNYVLPALHRPGYGYELSLGDYRGRIHCINGETGEYIWDYILPHDRVFDIRTYKIINLSVAKNGDVLGCGVVNDTDSEDRHHQSGFIFKITPDGNLKWMRIYKHLDDIIQPDYDLYYAPSGLFKVKELDNGDIIAVGAKITYYESTYDRTLWVLKVNESGCLPTEECQEEITFDSLLNVTETSEYWPIGTKWTYAYEWQEGFNIYHEYIQYEITDTLRENGELIHLVVSSRHDEPLKMKQDHLKMWFYNEDMEGYQLNYDFDARNVIHTVDDDCTGEYADLIMKVDSVGSFTLPDNEHDPEGFYELIRNQYIIGLQPEKEISQVLFGIGNLEGGLPVFSCSEDKARIGRIRCFESDLIKVNFQSPWYDTPPCDTIWTEVINHIIGDQKNVFHIYPNPAGDKLYLEYANSTNACYKIINTLGQVIIEGVLSKTDNYIDLSGIENGLYFFSVSNGNFTEPGVVRKFFKMDQ